MGRLELFVEFIGGFAGIACGTTASNILAGDDAGIVNDVLPGGDRLLRPMARHFILHSYTAIDAGFIPSPDFGFQ